MSIDLTNPIFNDQEAARRYLESLRWPNGPVCPHCGSTGDKIAAVQNTGKRTKEQPKGGRYRPARAGLYYCGECKGQFTVQLGSVMEKSHIPLNKWVAGFFMLCGSKKGVSAHQLHRQLHITYKSAWFMAHRIREAMRSGGLAPPAPLGSGGGIVEADETFFSAKKGTPKKGQRPAGYQHKHAILTLVERGGEARSFQIERASGSNIIPIVRKNVSKEAAIVTDEAKHYGHKLRSTFAQHETVNHAAEEWARGTIHTNTVEGYFSVFKRGMKGVYQHCSEKHLHRYLAEFDFRYSNRSATGVEDTERTERAIRKIEGRRLTYRRSHEAAE